MARAPELIHVGIIHLHIEGLAAPDAGHGISLSPSCAVRWPERSGSGERGTGGLRSRVPVDVPRLFDRGTLPLDAVLVNATMPDRHGFCSLGVSVEAIHAAIRAARTLVVQLNRAMPRTLGESFIHVEPHRPGGRGRCASVRAHHRARSATWNGGSANTSRSSCRTAPRSSSGSAPSRRQQPSRSTVKRDLGIHTEMFTDPVVDLVEAGVVTGARKERNRGKIVTAFLMGTQSAVRLRARQPDGRDAIGRLHQRHACHPLVRHA